MINQTNRLFLIPFMLIILGCGNEFNIPNTISKPHTDATNKYLVKEYGLVGIYSAKINYNSKITKSIDCIYKIKKQFYLVTYVKTKIDYTASSNTVIFDVQPTKTVIDGKPAFKGLFNKSIKTVILVNGTYIVSKK